MKSRLVFFLSFLALNAVAQVKNNPNRTDQFEGDSALLEQGFPVTPFGDTLFYIYEGIGPMKAQTRAAAITTRIEVLDSKEIFQEDSFRIERYESNEYVVYGDIPILTITDTDAKREGITQLDLAQKRLEQIMESTREYQEEFSFQTLIKKILLLGLLFLVIGVLVYGVNRLFRITYALIEKRLLSRHQGIKIGKATISNARHLSGLLISVAKWLKVFVIILLIYLSLPVIINLVPASKGITDTLLEYTLTPLKDSFYGVLDFIPNLFTIAAIVLIFSLFIRLFKIVATQISEGSIVIPGFYPDWAMSTYNIIQFFLYAFMIVVIFPYLPGSGSPVFQGVSVFLGLLFSFGSAGSISNIISGIVITYMRAFQLGDRIRVGDVEGDVMEKSMLVTRIKTIKEEEFSVPNSTLMNGTVKNYSKLARTGGLIIHTSVTIGYDAPWREIYKALLIAADKTEMILKDPKPFVLQVALNDFYVEYQINGYINDAQKMIEIYSGLRENIQDSFNDAGIEIMSSHYMNLRDGNKVTIPENYLPGDYQRPGFKIGESAK
ncbi:MAG: mechanosensitive ion channel domain-containing protein [Chitinophagales bacterium]